MATDKNNKIKTKKSSGARRNLTDIRLYGRHSFAPPNFFPDGDWGRRHYDDNGND